MRDCWNKREKRWKRTEEGDEEADGCSTLYSRPRLVSYEQEEDKKDMLDNCLPHL